MELRLARDEIVEAGAPRLAEVLDDAIDELRMADLVLDLRRERELPLQRRRAEDPVPLGQHAHQLGVAVHLDELDELRAIFVRHPVADVSTCPPAWTCSRNSCVRASVLTLVASLPNGR